MRMWFVLNYKDGDPVRVNDAISKIAKVVSENPHIASTLYKNPAKQVMYLHTSHMLKEIIEESGFEQTEVTENGTVNVLTLVKLWDEKTID